MRTRHLLLTATVLACLGAFNPAALRADITTGLVGWWALDETSGETAYDSANVLYLDGTLLPAGAGPTVNQTGRIGAGYYLDGSNDYLLFSNSASAGLMPATDDFSYFIWINMPALITTANAQGMLFNCNRGQPGRAASGVQNLSGANRVYWFQNGGLGAVYYGDPLTANTWYLVGVTRSNNVFTGWINTNSYDLGTSAGAISTDVDWGLGHQLSSGSYFKGYVDDLRVYNRPLNAADVLELYTQDPGLGPVQSLSLSLERTQMDSGTLQDAHADAEYLSVTNDVTGSATWQSSDTNVASVSGSGLITALSAGSTEIIASFSGKSATNTLTVVPLVTQMIHRYSFTSDATDAVGSNDGMLHGNASVSGGALVLASDTGDYVDLGPDAISGYNEISFEAWVSFGTNADWCRLFDFGDNDGANGTSFIYVTPRTSTGKTRIDIKSGAAQAMAESTGILDNQTNQYIAAVYNPLARYLKLYLNGKLVAENTNVFGQDLAGVANLYSFLGKSQYASNPGINMSLDEFRIYRGVLEPLNVAINAQSGPDTIITDPGALTSVTLTLASPLPEWASEQAEFLGDFDQASGLNLIGQPGVVFDSSDTNVATVDAAGLITAVAAGSATITASYSGQSNSQMLVVSAVPTTRVLVSAVSDNAVMAYDSKGTNWRTAGIFASGTYAGQTLAMPQGLAQDSAGAVYVAEEMYGGRILKFTTDGTFLGVVATSGVDFDGPPQFLALGPDNNLYMTIGFTTDGTDRIDKIALPGGGVTTIVPTTDGVNYSLQTPRGIAFGSDGYLYVANRGANLIQKFDPTNGAYAGDLLSMSQPNGLAWDATNNVLLVNSLNTAPWLRAVDLNGQTSGVLNDNIGRSIIGILRLGDDVYFADYGRNFIARVSGPTTIQTLFSLTHPTVMMAVQVPDVSLTAQYTGGNIVISWPGSGVLQQADEITGPYTDVPAATSPYAVPATAAKKFFRVRLQ